MKKLFSFPNPVNEHSARFVAAGVVAMCIGIVFFSQMWILAFLAYGFIARVLTGPTLSPLGQLVTRIVVPGLNKKPKLVPGAPKRFAQGIGAVLSSTALILWLSLDSSLPARIITAMILVAASLESIFGCCIGCVIFSYLTKLGIIPRSVCLTCIVKYD